MIINVDGRTDIVNYYSEWLINRIKEGYVYTRNPYNNRQVIKYDLSRNSVDAVVFCSKNYEAILNDMEYIKNKYPIFCYYTITPYEQDVELKVPNINDSIKTLSKLSSSVGKNKVSWRYDPILLTQKYTIDYHLESFDYMASQLYDKISFCVFSFVDMYKKLYRNMPEIIELNNEDMDELVKGLIRIAKKYDMPLQSCALGDKYKQYGVIKSGCITTDILEKSNSLTFRKIKHKGSRKGCTCMPWRDIGEYDTCLNACKYCYANKRPNIAIKKYKNHDPESPILIGHINKNDIIVNAKQDSFLKIDEKQSKLF